MKMRRLNPVFCVAMFLSYENDKNDQKQKILPPIAPIRFESASHANRLFKKTERHRLW